MLIDINIDDCKGCSGIYQLMSTQNNKIYIGSSVDIRKRVKDHFKKLSHNVHENEHLQNHYNKHGEHVFKIDILQTDVPVNELHKVEEMWITLKNATDRNIGFNIASVCGARHFLGKTHTVESKNKISKSLKGKLTGEHNPFYGKKHTEETKSKISNKKKGVKFTDEQKQSLAKSRENVDYHLVSLKSWQTRRENGTDKSTKESREKAWKTRRSKFGTDNGLGKPIIAFNEIGEEVMRFKSGKDAYRAGYTTASWAAKTGKQGKGYYWSYENDLT